MTNNKNAPVGHVCIHEDRFAHDEAQISQLETRADYKEKRLDTLEAKIEKIITTVDEVNNNLTKYLLQSNAYDKDLELELKAIKTKLDMQDKARQDQRKDTNLKLTFITLGLALLTFYFQYIHHP